MYVLDRAERPVGTRSMTTADVDEARVIIGTYFYPTFLDVLGPAADLSARFDLVTAGPVTIGDMCFGVDVGLRFGELGAYHVDLPLTGELWWRQGRRPAVARPDTAAVFQPVGDTTLERWPADCRLLAVKIDQRVLQTHLASLLDAPVRTPVALDTEFDVSSGPGRTWAGLVRVLATESRVSGGLLGHAAPAEHLQQSVIAGLLALTSPQYREAAGSGIRGWAPRTVKRVVEAMHARPAYPFTMGALAEIAGVGARALQDAFRRHVGTPPMAYLRDLRLANAHRELHRAGPEETTVAQVAYDAGFAHLGRFATAYRARYGVAPSQTLRS